MADVDTKPAEDNGAPAPADDKVAALTAARELLIAEGHQVLDSSAFHGIKTKAAADAEARASEIATKYESLQAEHTKLSEWKAKLDNEGKSENELHASERRAWMDQDKERIALLEVANKETTDLQKSLERERVQNRIAGLMSNTTNPEAALMWADKYIGKLLSTNDTGQLVWTDPTGIPHVGPAAVKLVTEWWASDAQKFLHAGNAPGPPTGGAPSAPSPQTPEAFKRDPAKSAMENYVAAEEWDAKQRAAQNP